MNQPDLPPTSPGILRRLEPCLLAFVASGCIMTVEVVAGRIIARHVGNSLYTWTSVIGVVLGGITIGNLMGGWLADLFRPRRTAAVLFFLAAAACLAIPYINRAVGEGWLAIPFIKNEARDGWLKVNEIESWPQRIATHVAVVFLVPSTVLGLIGPVVAKMALDLGLSTGRTVGNVYAWGALGSIVGTFLTGFYLIPSLSTTGIIFGVVAVLGVMGLAIAAQFTWPIFVAGEIIFVLQAWHGPWDWRPDDGRVLVRERLNDDTAIYVDESQYSFIKVTEDTDDGTRDLVLDNLIHAHYVPGDATDLRYEYEKIYANVTLRLAPPGDSLRALFLGGGGYIFPRYLLARWPRSFIEVAEIDPAVTRADIAAFGLLPGEIEVVGGSGVGEDLSAIPIEDGEMDGGGEPETAPGSGDANPEALPPSPIQVHHLDARNHVDDLVRRKREGKDFEPFDFVYGDAFNDYSVPFHLTTREFAQKIAEILRPSSGLYLINIIDIYHYGRFLGSILNTMRDVFPHVYIFSNTDGGPDTDEDGRDTFIVVGAFRELDLKDLGKREGEMEFTGSLLEEEHLKTLVERSKGIVLTDDFAPVENLLEVVVRKR